MSVVFVVLPLSPVLCASFPLAVCPVCFVFPMWFLVSKFLLSAQVKFLCFFDPHEPINKVAFWVQRCFRVVYICSNLVSHTGTHDTAPMKCHSWELGCRLNVFPVQRYNNSAVTYFCGTITKLIHGSNNRLPVTVSPSVFHTQWKTQILSVQIKWFLLLLCRYNVIRYTPLYLVGFACG